jgi:UDP-glucose 4-epimerase
MWFSRFILSRLGGCEDMKVLVVGGAGYIGSHAVRALNKQGYQVTVLDNLSKGHAEAVPEEILVVGDTADAKLLDRIIQEKQIQAVMHFGAFSLVGESMLDPGKYFHNNVASGIVLLDAMVRNNVKYLVFSSTAAVYGEPENIPIREDAKLWPTNPYGESKLAFEKILGWYDKAHGLKSICLRYFNAAGADEAGDIGEDHSPETHLIPLVIQTALGIRESIKVFGDDYPTPDGTCIRDYIHINDLADAHILALEALAKGAPSNAYNLGNGNGYSVLEVIKAVEQVTGKRVNVIMDERRPGDPAVLVASPQKASMELGWEPKFTSLESIVKTAWAWHQDHSHGYK